MTAVNSIHSLVLHTIQYVSSDRLQRAVCGLTDGSLTVILTRQHEVEIRALVKNSDGKEYGVTLTEAVATCSCKDALYRGVICKHAVAVALQVLRTPQSKREEAVSAWSSFHLMWRDGTVLCSVRHPDRFWSYPWTDYMLTWPEACPDCVAIYRSDYNRHLAMKEAA